MLVLVLVLVLMLLLVLVLVLVLVLLVSCVACLGRTCPHCPVDTENALQICDIAN
jgi:hypothetical protein